MSFFIAMLVGGFLGAAGSGEVRWHVRRGRVTKIDFLSLGESTDLKFSRPLAR